MTLVDTSRVMVVVVGRRPEADGAALVAEAATTGAMLRLLVVGYPLSEGQRAVEAAVLAEAERRDVHVELRLVLSTSGLRNGLEPVGEVRILAEPRESRRLQRAMRP
jgi:hypothetical protein